MNLRVCSGALALLLFVAAAGWSCSSSALAQDYYQMDDNAIAHFHRGEMWMEVQQYEAAIREFQIAIRLKPVSSFTAALYNNLGLAYLSIREFPKAIVSFQQALTLNPGFSLYYENLVKAYGTSGAIEPTRQHLQQLVQSNPEDAQSWFLLGLLYRESGDPTASEQAFQAYIKLAPDSELAKAAKLYLDRLQTSQTNRE